MAEEPQNGSPPFDGPWQALLFVLACFLACLLACLFLYLINLLACAFSKLLFGRLSLQQIYISASSHQRQLEKVTQMSLCLVVSSHLLLHNDTSHSQQPAAWLEDTWAYSTFEAFCEALQAILSVSTFHDCLSFV